jgi:ATP adenylyltransferase
LFEYPLLIVTREFEEQESVLTYEDFYSIGLCLSEMDGLAFYNGGLKAGATQPHKHFHFIPYPLGQSFTTVPMDEIIQTMAGKDEFFSLETLPYQHLISRLDEVKGDSPEATAKMLVSKYKTLMQSMAQINLNRKYSYNLIVTKNWMKIALRSAPSYVAISLNSLGFAGIFNVRSEFQVNQIKDLTPLTILQGVGVPKSPYSRKSDEGFSIK